MERKYTTSESEIQPTQIARSIGVVAIRTEGQTPLTAFDVVAVAQTKLFPISDVFFVYCVRFPYLALLAH